MSPAARLGLLQDLYRPQIGWDDEAGLPIYAEDGDGFITREQLLAELDRIPMVTLEEADTLVLVETLLRPLFELLSR